MRFDTLLYPGETGTGTVMSCFEKLKWCFKMDIGKKLIAKYQKKKKIFFFTNKNGQLEKFKGQN